MIQEKDDSSDHAQDNKQESSSSEEGKGSVGEEDEVEDELNPKSEPSNNEFSKDHSRESSHHSFNKKSEEGSNSSYETNQRLQDDLDLPTEEPVQPLCRSSRVPKPVIRYENVYGNKPATQIEK